MSDTLWPQSAQDKWHQFEHALGQTMDLSGFCLKEFFKPPKETQRKDYMLVIDELLHRLYGSSLEVENAKTEMLAPIESMDELYSMHELSCRIDSMITIGVEHFFLETLKNDDQLNVLLTLKHCFSQARLLLEELLQTLFFNKITPPISHNLHMNKGN